MAVRKGAKSIPAALKVLTLSALIWITCSPATLAQTLPAFEVASVKAIPDSDGWPPRAGYYVPPRVDDPQRFRTKTLLSQVIEWAYGVREFQIEGGPAWLKQGRFEIQATTGRPSTEAEMRQMLRTLLADQFKLKVHRGSKEVAIYALVVARKGSKLTPTKDDVGFQGDGNFNVGRTILVSRGGTMAGLCKILTDNLERPVIDKTGLQGRYDFKLTFEPPADAGPGWNPIGAGIFTPIQDLGLKLQPQKDRIDLLIIDSAERPPEN